MIRLFVQSGVEERREMEPCGGCLNHEKKEGLEFRPSLDNITLIVIDRNFKMMKKSPLATLQFGQVISGNGNDAFGHLPAKGNGVYRRVACQLFEGHELGSELFTLGDRSEDLSRNEIHLGE